MNFENVLDTLYELYKNMSLNDLENEMREWPSTMEIGSHRVIMKIMVICALMDTKKKVSE